MLRPKSKEDQGGQSSEGHLLTFGVEEAKIHDISILPHMYPDKDKRKMFPVIGAPKMMPNADDYEMYDGEGCRARRSAEGIPGCKRQ